MSVPWARGRLVSVGECMIELARGGDGRFGLAYGGDTFNTAVYLARAGVEVAYATALGDDPYSSAIKSLAEKERIATDLIATIAGRMPGLYLIETTNGERTFWYWRDRAPARELFEIDAADRIVRGIEAAGVVYFSGVTLSLYSERGLERFHAALRAARSNGVAIAMDSNYRPRGWAGNVERARATFERFWRLSTIALPTFDDEQALWGDATAESVADRLGALGVSEIVVKLGRDGAFVASGGWRQAVPASFPVEPVDTTAAGDSFNAAYLAARRAGAGEIAAAEFGNRLAAIVIQHPGAIVPAEATARVLRSLQRPASISNPPTQ
jgi:2-dehydro-3-deoxygluconokinase